MRTSYELSYASRTYLGAKPNECNVESRNGYANEFKPSTFQTLTGKLDLSILQVRNSDQLFRSSLLNKVSRSDRALKTAIATMYVEGVSTRKVTKTIESLCGFEVSSTQASRLTAKLDNEFTKWRNRPLAPIQYLIIDVTCYNVRIDGTLRDCATLIAIGGRTKMVSV